MSAALQLPAMWASASQQEQIPVELAQFEGRIDTGQCESEVRPDQSLAFYRRHTENLLRRYLYASMRVGRTPSLLDDAVGRGYASSHTMHTFEDAVIFVLDIEHCIAKLGALDRRMLSRIVLQEYTQAEAASLLGMSTRAVCYKFPLALDRLTELLLEKGLLVLPPS